ncbi:MAG: ribosome small subunit-dependent GTPase A [Saccharospirillum sp.]
MNNTLRTLGLVPFFTQQLSDMALLETQLGRVVAVQRSRSTVLCGAGERVVEMAPAVRDLPAIDRPTVGDWVLLDAALARIEAVLERKSLFKRLGAGEGGEVQPIAANVDTLFIVTSCNEEFKESRLERYLALCAEAGAMPVIVLTKADLADDVERYIQRARRAQAGVAVEAVNAQEAASVERLRAWVDGTTTVALVGSSGVGKSTLLNTLSGHERAATAGIREDDKKGRHTTTHRELHRLPTGGLLIDVPGMRELKIVDVGESLDVVFDDIERLAKQCKFSDCQHASEPGCAVNRAISEGRLDPRRLSNYQKMQRENAQATATQAEKRAQGRQFARVVKGVKALKQSKREG